MAKNELTGRDPKQLALIAPYVSRTGLKLPAATSYEHCEDVAVIEHGVAEKQITWLA